jgi:hypothetical protein
MRCCLSLLSPYDRPIVAGRVGEDWQHGGKRFHGAGFLRCFRNYWNYWSWLKKGRGLPVTVISRRAIPTACFASSEVPVSAGIPARCGDTAEPRNAGIRLRTEPGQVPGAAAVSRPPSTARSCDHAAGARRSWCGVTLCSVPSPRFREESGVRSEGSASGSPAA